MDDSPFDSNPELWSAPRPIPPPMPVVARAEVVAGGAQSIPFALARDSAPGWRIDHKSPPRVWTVFVAFGLFFTMLILVSLIVVILRMSLSGGFDFQSFELTLNDLLVLMVASVALTCGVSISAAILSPVPATIRLGLMKPRLNPLLWLIAPVTCYALSLGITMLVMAAQVQFKLEDLFAIDQLVDGEALWKQVLGVLLVSLGAGFGEELLFRGYMQTRLTQRLGFAGSLVIVSILFGIIHMNLIQIVFATLLGMFVGTLAHRSGSIWPAIWCHTFSNFCAVMVTYNLPEMSASQHLSITGVCVAVVALGTFSTLMLTRPYPRGRAF